MPDWPDDATTLELMTDKATELGHLIGPVRDTLAERLGEDFDQLDADEQVRRLDEAAGQLTHELARDLRVGRIFVLGALVDLLANTVEED